MTPVDHPSYHSWSLGRQNDGAFRGWKESTSSTRLWDGGQRRCLWPPPCALTMTCNSRCVECRPKILTFVDVGVDFTKACLEEVSTGTFGLKYVNCASEQLKMSLTEGWWFHSLLLNQISSFVAGELILRIILSREMHGAKMLQACSAAFTFLYHGCLLHPDSLCTSITQSHFVVIYMQTNFAVIDGLSRTHTVICFSTMSQCNDCFVCLVEHATEQLQTYILQRLSKID